MPRKQKPSVGIYTSKSFYDKAEMIGWSLEESDIPYQIREVDPLQAYDIAREHAENDICGVSVIIDEDIYVFSDQIKTGKPAMEYMTTDAYEEKKMRQIGNNIAGILLKREIKEV